MLIILAGLKFPIVNYMMDRNPLYKAIRIFINNI